MSLFVNIEKTLGNFRLDVRFETEDGVLALLGASGCGKSMTLKCIAGIERPDRGRIVLDGATLFDSEAHINLTPQKRKVGYLFQQYALFPNMTVEENIAAGVRDRRRVSAVVSDMMQSMHLTGTEKLHPHQLSGGQQQRVALARILVNEPNALLLDEPFSALDSHLRFQMEQEVREVIQSFGKTVLLVSHNRDEAFRLSDHIAIMYNGVIQTQDTKEQLFENPRTRNGAVLTGCKNISAVKRLDGRRVRALEWNMDFTADAWVDGAEYIGIRMHDICMGPGENEFHCRIAGEIENPFSYTVLLRPENAGDAAAIVWELDKETRRKLQGDTVTIHVPGKAILLLKEDSAWNRIDASRCSQK